VVAADFSLDGRHIVSAGDSTARLWRLSAREPALVLRGHEGGLTALAFSPDGQRLLTAAPDGTARIWDVRTGKEELVLGKSKLLGDIRSAYFSADGRRVVTASANKVGMVKGKVVNESAVHLWDAATGAGLL